MTHAIRSDLTESQDKPMRINLINATSSPSDYAYVLVATLDGAIHMRRHGTGEYRESYLGQHHGKIFGMQLYNYDKKFVSAAHEGTICSWDISKGEPLWRIRTSVELFTMTIAGEQVVVGGRDGSLRVVSLYYGSVFCRITISLCMWTSSIVVGSSSQHPTHTTM